MTNPAPRGTGDTLDEVVDYYYRFLARNRDLNAHLEQYKKRLNGDPKAAQAEAIALSWLRAESLKPKPFEDTNTGGPDFECVSPNSVRFLVEVTSLDSEVVSKRSDLPLSISGPGGQAYGLITESLFSEVKNKARQLGRFALPGVLAITSDHFFAGILLDRLAAEYLMTSAPQTNVPLDGGPTYTTTDLKHSAFYQRLKILDASGAPIIQARRQSVSAVLLIAIYPHEVQMVGVLHPEAIHPFDPAWLPKVPFLKSKGLFLSDRPITTEWIQAEAGQMVGTFPHRRIR